MEVSDITVCCIMVVILKSEDATHSARRTKHGSGSESGAKASGAVGHPVAAWPWTPSQPDASPYDATLLSPSAKFQLLKKWGRSLLPRISGATPFPENLAVTAKFPLLWKINYTSLDELNVCLWIQQQWLHVLRRTVDFRAKEGILILESILKKKNL